MSLRTRLLWGTLAVAAVALAAGIVGGLVIQNQVRNAAQQELFRQGQVTAELVERELRRTPLRNAGRVADVLANVELVGGHDFVEAAMIQPAGLLSALADGGPLLAALPNDVSDRGVVEVEVEGTPVLATVRRVEVGNTPRSILIAIGRVEDFRVAGIVTRTVLIALMAGVLMAIALSISLSRSVGRRLGIISLAARSYADGDFSARAPETGKDELAEVGHAFNEMAAELNESRRRERDFLMNVGHDLRTPLTTIRGYAEGLDAGDIPPEELPRVAGVIHAQTDRLSRLVEDLMLLARIEAREFTLRPEPVDLAAHVKETVDEVRFRADDARVRVEADLRPVGMVQVDADRISQVVANLLDNALRYTPEGGRVAVRLVPVANGALIEVVDNGPGIEESDLVHVFERLYVAQRYRPLRPEGSGLGLSITKELVDAMAGTITVQSTLGFGTTVSVTIPVAGSTLDHV